MKAITTLKRRTYDKWGLGHYGASRGARTHKGVDYACRAGAKVLAPCGGEVTKLGYPYSDDLSFRYVQITTKNEDHRVFYVKPMVKLGNKVDEETVIGIAQDLEERYPGITPHIHYEVKIDDKFVNPEGEHDVS